MKHPALGYVLVLFALAALVSACATGTGAAPVDNTTDAPSRETRSDCSQILGTPFRSTEERAWFEKNCSKWPLVDVPNAAAVQLPPECAAMRGKPYTSADQRQWFLANCNANGVPTPAPATGSRSTGSFSTPSQFSDSNDNRDQGNDQSQPGGIDRTDCNEIRGTAYRSSSERAWFAANCAGTSNGGSNGSNNNDNAQQGSSNSRQSSSSSGFPRSSANDRSDCFAISGTPYRSQNEQAWYLANCFPPRSNQNDDNSSNRNRGNNND